MAHTSADATSLSPWWRHSVILVMIAGFSVLSFVTVLTYTNAPPIPVQAVDANGRCGVYRGRHPRGQEVFLKYGLMEHGTLWGHGAYLGPDYSAEYLHRLSEITRDTIATEKYGELFAQLSPDEQSVAAARTIVAAQGKPVRTSFAHSPALARRGSCLPHGAWRMERLLHPEGCRSRPARQLYSRPRGAEST